MPIVFVHGVNNRDSAAYRESEEARNGFLREIVGPALGLKRDELTILSPYWGDDGARFAWNLAVLPDPGADFEAFGAAEDLAKGRVAGLLAVSSLSGNVVEDARTDFPAAVELLYASAMAGAKSEEEARDLAKSYVLAADYAEKNPAPAWVAGATEGNFADQLVAESDAAAEESFGAGGILDSLKEGLSRLTNLVPDVTTAVAGRLFRDQLNDHVTRFTGDAFTYLARRGGKTSPGKIVKIVLDALRAGRDTAKATGEPLVVVAHSFGGEIVYDILTTYDPKIQVDCLITVGSQVGLFEEMKLYVASQADVPADPKSDRVPRPPAIKRWLNVFDHNDILSYCLEPVVADVSDFHYDTGYSSLGAHGGYFLRPSFYKRLAKRLKGV